MSMPERWNAWLDLKRERYGRRRVNMLCLLAIAGLASLMIRLLILRDLNHTALLYLAIPYWVAVLITLMRPDVKQVVWWQRYASHAGSALIVFLASSIFLAEGFICVMLFMPIYFLGVTAAFVSHWISVTRDARKGKTYSMAIPAIIALLSMEGTLESTSFDRHNTVTATATATLAPDELLRNLATGFQLPRSDDWMLSLFPMPYAIEAGSLAVGDIHRAHTRYHRWFVTNTHEGEIELRIDSVTPERVAVTFTRDTSYFSSYVNLIGSEIRLLAGEDGVTHVSLTISYERRLDPAWYFHPIQQHAMQAMAAHLVREIIIRD